MSILVNDSTRVIVQGITGRDGSFHSRQMMEYGTAVVAGVTPGKGGQTFDGPGGSAVPIFNTTFVTVTRKLSGVPISRGKADHINYRLLAHGLSRGRALVAVYVLSAVAGTIGLLVVRVTPLAYAVGTFLFVTLLMYLGVFLSNKNF